MSYVAGEMVEIPKDAVCWAIVPRDYDDTHTVTVLVKQIRDEVVGLPGYLHSKAGALTKTVHCTLTSYGHVRDFTFWV